MKYLFPRRTVSLALVLVLALWLAACATTTPPPPTRLPTRTPRALAGPTKFAYREPTATPQPTRTPRPTRTPVPTATDEPTRAAPPTRRPTDEPEAQAAAAAIPAAPPATEAAPEKPVQPGVLTAWPAEGACNPASTTTFGVLGAHAGARDRPAESHPDLNLALRGYREVGGVRALVDYDGAADENAPQLWGLFADRRTPAITRLYQVFDWDWGANARGRAVRDFGVTLVGLSTTPGETIFAPDFGLELGEGYVALVLYAAPDRVTLKYTGEDDVVAGYTLHLEGICVEAPLLQLYNKQNGDGRGGLPALRPGQAIGYAIGSDIGVAIRDRGAFLDPRSRKDWWIGR